VCKLCLPGVTHAQSLAHHHATQALQYKGRIGEATPKGSSFTPLMTCYLTDNTPPGEVQRARGAGVAAFKLYPAGATTNSGARLQQSFCRTWL